MKHLLGVRVFGPLARYAPGFVAELVGVGYRPNAAAVQLRLLAHLSRWLEREGIDPVEVCEPQLERFREEDLARSEELADRWWAGATARLSAWAWRRAGG